MKTATRKRRYTGLRNGRVTWDAPENLTCMILAQHGLHAYTIAQHTGLTESQVHYRCRMMGVHLVDYRNGHTPAAKQLCSQYTVNHVRAWVKDEKEVSTVAKRIGLSRLAHK